MRSPLAAHQEPAPMSSKKPVPSKEVERVEPPLERRPARLYGIKATLEHRRYGWIRREG
jgi:hypothetical protein